MNLAQAKSIVVRERMDWSRPHLAWIPRRFYGFKKRK
ncbi:hypothetical protein TA5114_00843 [Cognatishimia activa]|uniref:Uncharacterized protein n=1 Tax=Cognatishimia activa TaxID=1715691 RepID=A0A0P1IN56_9RHOB|nr:hypothetical protein TA5113_02493 [Cognatishimia activa]CUK25053.1 hypothetical protein TA5114_00843 [Cognatishimia activa]